MELFILITVNVITAAAIYVVFAIRFRVAVEKARRAPIMQDLRENIEAAIAYIGTSIELMDRKNRAFAETVQRAEQIAARLEATLEKRPPARRRRTPKRESTAEVSTDDPIARLLERLGSDSFEPLAPPSGESHAARRDAPPGSARPPLVAQPTAVTTVRDWASIAESPVPAPPPNGLGRVGAFVGRLFGISTKPTRSDLVPPSRDPDGAAANFGDVLSSTADRLEQKEKGPPVPEKGSSGRSAARDVLDLSEEARTRATVAEARAGSSERPALSMYMTDPVELAPAPDEFDPAPSARDGSDASGLDQPVPELGPVPETGPERREFVTRLLVSGHSVDRIAAATGISRAEIELTALLPARRDAARRLRRRDE